VWLENKCVILCGDRCILPKDKFYCRNFWWIIGVTLVASDCTTLGTLLWWYHHHELCDVMRVLKLRDVLLYFVGHCRFFSTGVQSSSVSDTVCVCSYWWGFKQTTNLVILVIQQRDVFFQSNRRVYHTKVTLIIVIFRDVLRNRCFCLLRKLDWNIFVN